MKKIREIVWMKGKKILLNAAKLGTYRYKKVVMLEGKDKGEREREKDEDDSEEMQQEEKE